MNFTVWRRAFPQLEGSGCLSAAIGAGIAFTVPDPVSAQQITQDEIIVTALHHNSLPSKTPLAITALSGDVLRSAGVTDVSTLDDLVPNMSVDRDNGIQITIRGVTSSDGTEKGDPSAAFLLDGTYLARPQVLELSFFDVERVEIVRGPQGTLYGRNTTAGLVNLISAPPRHALEARVDGAYGSFDSFNGTAVVNIPATDTIALRAALNYDRRDSFLRRGAGGASLDPFRDVLSGRLSALFEPAPDVSLLVRADYAQFKGTNFNSVALANFFDVPEPFPPSITDQLFERRTTSAKDARTLTWPERPTSRDNRSWGLSADLNWNLGQIAFTYLGSYREYRRDEVGSFLRGLNDTIYLADYWQNSQEVRALIDTGPVHSQAGIYYFKERSRIANFLIDPLLPDLPPGARRYGFQQDPTISESWAGFGQTTLDVGDRVHITAGLRYSSDRKSRIGATLLELGDGTLVALTRNDAKRRFQKTTWRIGADYDAPGLGLLYASVATGYKAGGFNDGCQAGQGPGCSLTEDVLYYRPETLTAYEAGFKLRFVQDSIKLNGSIFHYDYKGLQLTQIATDLCGGPCQLTTNAAKARIDGIEVEALVDAAEGHRLNLTLNLLDAHYTDYFPAPAVDYQGKSLDRSPKFSASAGYSFTRTVGASGSISADARIRFSSSYVLTDLAARIRFQQPHFHKTDLSVTYTAPRNRFYVQAYARNLENEISISTATAAFLGSASFSDPRTFGMRVGARF